MDHCHLVRRAEADFLAVAVGMEADAWENSRGLPDRSLQGMSHSAHMTLYIAVPALVDQVQSITAAIQASITTNRKKTECQA